MNLLPTVYHRPCEIKTEKGACGKTTERMFVERVDRNGSRGEIAICEGHAYRRALKRSPAGKWNRAFEDDDPFAIVLAVEVE